ncbi:MAG: type II/IV secretion system protein [Elusimicrobia bacterium]|nr:type II/IV secretion system protein [Elusimicrobiota bacterium]
MAPKEERRGDPEAQAKPGDSSDASPDADLKIGREEATVKKAEITDVDISSPEVEKFANAMILEAINMKASDIHIEPFDDPGGKRAKVLVRYRVDGALREGKMRIPWADRNAIISKIKIMTGSMNISEKRIPQSGRIQVLVRGNPIEFRVEVIPSAFGEACVMRILDRASVQVDIEKMGFLPDTQEKFLGLLQGIGGKRNSGLILCCGPTGSGKSTTLYAALNYINKPEIKILTAENPVEYNLDGIIQVPINPELKLGEDKRFSFAMALRSFVRQDPDVIMVGEIRDEETAETAIEAAMTGHLVFSTVHTNDAPSAIGRLVEMGMPAYLVASTIKAILGQRLSRRLCAGCNISHEPTSGEIEVFKTNGVDLPKDAKLCEKGAGCPRCAGNGFKGRMGQHELMVMSDRLRATCINSVSADVLRKVALEEGMRLLIQDGLEKAKTGITTVREVLGGGESEAK